MYFMKISIPVAKVLVLKTDTGVKAESSKG